LKGFCAGMEINQIQSRLAAARHVVMAADVPSIAGRIGALRVFGLGRTLYIVCLNFGLQEWASIGTVHLYDTSERERTRERERLESRKTGLCLC
jgi:hypothetical protein